MKKLIFIAACALLAGCGGSQKGDVLRGKVMDASMNTLMIVTAAGDTLSFSTMNADRAGLDDLFIGDSVEVGYTGKYVPGMEVECISVLKKIK